MVVQLNASSPASNTGVNCQDGAGVSVRIDWYQGSGDFATWADFQGICDFVAGCLNDEIIWSLDTPGFMGRRWHSTGKTVRGCRFFWNPPKGDGCPGRGLVCIPGSALREKTEKENWGMLCGLSTPKKWRSCFLIPTRIDIALDDYEKRIDLQYICDAARSGNYTQFLLHTIYESSARGCSDAGRTIRFGSGQSDKLLRIYDKEFESGGEIKSHRFEVQLRNAFANEFITAYTAIDGAEYDELAYDCLASVVLGAIDFIDRESGDRVSRMDRLPWWSEFVEYVGTTPNRITAPKRVQSFMKKLGWLYRQVCTSFAMVREVFGDVGFDMWVRDFVHTGCDRFDAIHDAQVKIFKSEWIDKNNMEVATW